VYRTNTFPLIHLNTIHVILNILALTPLMERFEHETGTLTVLALFLGRESTGWHAILRIRLTVSALSTIPAIMYVVLEKLIFRGDKAVMGARFGSSFLPLELTVLTAAASGCSCSSVSKRSRHTRSTPTSLSRRTTSQRGRHPSSLPSPSPF
jgi:hypothetical protein